MPADRKRLRLTIASLALSASLLGGCANGTNPADPFESFNRGVYSFNEGFDKAIMKPVAEVYRAVLPQFIRSSVGNFFGNVNDILTALNNLLQGKFTTAYTDFGRVAINSTLGILGLFDIATEAGIEKHEEDFGQTLGWWGMGDGPFIMLPFLGPSTGRDAVGRVVDYLSDPVTYVDPQRASNTLWGVRIVNRRSELLEASEVLQTAALDPYEFVRDAYLQRRRNLINDGLPPSDRGEFLDPPPKARSSAPRTPSPSASEPYGPLPMVVAGSQAPIQSSYAPDQRASTAPAPKRPARVAAATAYAPMMMGDASSSELIPPGQMTIPGATPPPAQKPLPSLASLWRMLGLNR